MHYDRANRDWIERARAVSFEDVLAQRGVLNTLKGRNSKLAGPCPRCGGRDRFSVNLDKEVFYCRQCDHGGGGTIDLAMFVDDCDFVSAVESLTGEPRPKRERRRHETDNLRVERDQRERERLERFELERRKREQREAAELRNAVGYCDRLWNEAGPLPPEAIAYFRRRYIDIDDVPDHGGLRFHPACPFDGVKLPCILARYTSAATNEPGGIWRRPVTGEKPKALAPVKDHIIRLWPDADVTRGLVIAEGVETTLSAATKQVHRGTLLQPAWACGFAQNMRDFPLLPGIEHLTILADADASSTGQDAARACAHRWSAAGCEAEVLTPITIGFDFNDIVRATP